MIRFKIWLENTDKLLILMRGVSGSGKSTVAQNIANATGGTIFSTDDFFMQNGKYVFDQSQISSNHLKNQQRTEAAMARGVSPIIIDNTHTQAWEMKPYYDLATKYGYRIEIKQPGDADFPDVGYEELLRRQKTRHGGNKNLGQEVVRRMLGDFQRGVTLDDIKNSQLPD